MVAIIAHKRKRTITGAHAAARQRRVVGADAVVGGAMFTDALRDVAFRGEVASRLQNS